ncbi:MAG: hypothetical protein HZA00_04570 [Nitrospinae bacterium]|nr:hypothetical protein [Nitrospinota bacterium]
MSDKDKREKWRQFPNPEKSELLHAPFGAGVYKLRHKLSKENILFGSSKNVAYRMTSLLPDYGGNRKNEDKREHVKKYIDDIEYTTIACNSEEEAREIEEEIKKKIEKGQCHYIFDT